MKQISRLKSRLRLKWFSLRAKWPPVAQNHHQQQLTYLKSRISELEHENAETKYSMDSVLPKLVRASMVQPTPTNNRYRLVLDLDPFLIRDAFVFGNDKRMIDCFAERVGMMVRRELHTINMHRFEEVESRTISPYGGVPETIVRRW